MKNWRREDAINRKLEHATHLLHKVLLSVAISVKNQVSEDKPRPAVDEKHSRNNVVSVFQQCVCGHIVLSQPVFVLYCLYARLRPTDG